MMRIAFFLLTALPLFAQDAPLRLRPGMPESNPAGVPLLNAQVPDADRQAAGVSLEPETPYRWIASSDAPFKIIVKSADQVILTAWDWEDRPVFQRPVVDETLAFEVEGRGTYVVTADKMSGRTCSSRLVRSFSICPPNLDRRKDWDADRFWIGQCSFPGWHNGNLNGHPVAPPGLTEDESRNLDAELVARMGVQIARINFPVVRKDVAGMELDFAMADKCVRAYEDRGLRLDLQILASQGAGRGPILDKYAQVPVGEAYLHPMQEKPYRHFVKEIARRYGRHASFYQVWNEPGNSHQYKGTSEDYVATVKQARDVLDRAPLTNGGYCFTNKDTQDVIRGLRGVTDFVSYHWHGDLAGLKDQHAQMVKLHAEAGYNNPAFANTEMGMGISSVGQESAHARCVLQKILYCWAHEHKGVMLYSSRELFWPRQYSSPVPDYGFVDYFYCPRFVYGAVAAFIDRYAGARFDDILTETDNLHAYRFVRGTDILVAVFAAKAPAEIRLKSNAREGALIDPMGNESPLEGFHNVVLAATGYPRTLVFRDATSVTRAGP